MKYTEEQLAHANKVIANECGIETEINDEFPELDDSLYWINGSEEWTIVDTRCREIVREKFKIETLFDYNLKNWFAEGQKRMDTGRGKTIAESEISCILNIVDSLDEA